MHHERTGILFSSLAEQMRILQAEDRGTHPAGNRKRRADRTHLPALSDQGSLAAIQSRTGEDDRNDAREHFHG